MNGEPSVFKEKEEIEAQLRALESELANVSSFDLDGHRNDYTSGRLRGIPERRLGFVESKKFTEANQWFQFLIKN
jgi:hypothetical protein